MSLNKRDRFLEDFKKNSKEYDLIKENWTQIGPNNWEAQSETVKDLLSSYYMFEYIN